MVCSLPPTQKDSFPTQRRHCEAGPPAGGGGAGGMATGSRAAVGEAGQPCRALRDTQVPEQAWPSSHLSSRGVEGLGATRLSIHHGRTQAAGEGELCAWALCGQ